MRMDWGMGMGFDAEYEYAIFRWGLGVEGETIFRNHQVSRTDTLPVSFPSLTSIYTVLQFLAGRILGIRMIGIEDELEEINGAVSSVFGIDGAGACMVEVFDC